MELREGMYIRSKDKRGNQFVRRIVELPTVPTYGSIVVDKDIHNVKWVSKKNVLKASDSIIDLIEVGDYVNGCYVLDFETLQNREKAIIVNSLDSYGWGQGVIPTHEIISIVTKEQFESMKYWEGM